MDFLFLGVACTENAIKESDEKYYKGNSTVRPQQYFDLNLVKGLSKKSRVKAISEPPVSSLPKSDCLYYKRKKDVLSENLTIKYISVINIFGIKTIMITLNILFESIMFCIFKNRKKSAIMLGYLSFYTWLPVMLISKLFRFNVFAVVPDVPRFSKKYSRPTSQGRVMLDRIFIKLDKICVRGVDGFVFLTKFMDDLINIKKKPYIVVEGFINVSEIQSKVRAPMKKEKVVMYAGTLHEKFGIKKLIEAFNFIVDKETELWIFGEGDYLDSIKIEANINNRIKYKGTKSRNEIQEIERNVTLLINPRPTDEVFTKYSFPSKTLEYMSSGTPLITTKLLGIPEEYYNYIYFFENEDKESMAKDIEKILSLSEEDLYEFGLKAQNFVLEHKSNYAQAEKIIHFVQNGQF